MSRFVALLCLPFVHGVNYDYVVVGGGVAGCVVASRLAERHSVLLLNIAGPPPARYNGPVVLTDELIMKTNLTATPGMSAYIHQPGYKPVPHFSTSQTGSSPARFLGGSSVVGLSLFMYDHDMDWAPSWDAKAMQNYFLKMKIQPTYHPNYLHPLTEKFLKVTGSAQVTPLSQRPDGTKITATAAYLHSAPAGLKIMYNVRADRLIIEHGICTGVVVRDTARGVDREIFAGKEVLVTAGYAYSPRLLFLSGIGDANELRAAGIKVVRDLPAVGQHLTAPRFTPISWNTDEPTLSKMMGAPISTGKAVPESFQSAVAEATVHLGKDAIAQFMPLYYAPKSAPMQYSLQGESWPLTTNAYTMLVTMRTAAQGSIKFDKDPNVSPHITHDAMTAEDLKRGEELVDEAKHMGSALPSSGQVEHEQDWSAVYDGRGTCRMGKDPRTSVVDLMLRVHGVKGLRVVDGSVIPQSTPFLAMPEVLALAERAADLIDDVETFAVTEVPFGTPLLSLTHGEESVLGELPVPVGMEGLALPAVCAFAVSCTAVGVLLIWRRPRPAAMDEYCRQA